MKIYQRILGLSLMGLMSFGAASCSNTEVGIGVGAAVGGIIGSNVGRSNYYRPGYYRPGCYRCYNYSYQLNSSPDNSLSSSNDNQSNQDRQMSDITSVAEKYHISYQASDLIVSSLRKAEKQDYSGLKDLGLTSDDVMAIYQNQSLKPESIQALGQNLNMDNSHTSALVVQMTTDIQAAKIQQANHE